MYSGKYLSSGTLGSLALKRSILLRKRMMLVRRNHRELMTLSNNTSDSFMRFCPVSSRSTWSYSERATQKMIEVTASKQWIHFLRSERCPPTSNMLWAQSPSIAVRGYEMGRDALDAELARLEFGLADTSRF